MLYCEICYETYSRGKNRPMVGTCGHTICYSCVIHLGNDNCPTCRREDAFSIPSVNFAIAKQMTEIPMDTAAERCEVEVKRLEMKFEKMINEVNEHHMGEMWDLAVKKSRDASDNLLLMNTVKRLQETVDRLEISLTEEREINELYRRYMDMNISNMKNNISDMKRTVKDDMYTQLEEFSKLEGWTGEIKVETRRHGYEIELMDRKINHMEEFLSKVVVKNNSAGEVVAEAEEKHMDEKIAENPSPISPPEPIKMEQTHVPDDLQTDEFAKLLKELQDDEETDINIGIESGLNAYPGKFSKLMAKMKSVGKQMTNNKETKKAPTLKCSFCCKELPKGLPLRKDAVSVECPDCGSWNILKDANEGQKWMMVACVRGNPHFQQVPVNIKDGKKISCKVCKKQGPAFDGRPSEALIAV